jgi:hypothetical protein
MSKMSLNRNVTVMIHLNDRFGFDVGELKTICVTFIAIQLPNCSRCGPVENVCRSVGQWTELL